MASLPLCYFDLLYFDNGFLESEAENLDLK